MRSTRLRSVRAGLPAAIVVVAVAALLVSVPVPTRPAPMNPEIVIPSAETAYTVTWNGVDVSTASGPSSALSIDLASTANLVYWWRGGTPVNISDARLQMFYFGFAVSSRDQVLTNPSARTEGWINLSWAPLSIDYLLEGVYRLTASFLAPNGTTMWSENFYVRGTAPLGFVALIPIILLLIIVYEVYALLRSGPYASLGRKAAAPPPPVGPPGPTPPAETGGPSAPASENPPPSGGGS